MNNAELSDYQIKKFTAGKRSIHFPGKPPKRQQEILALMVDGMDLIQIGQRLCISPKTVSHYVGRLRETLELKTTSWVAIVLSAARRGWVDLKLDQQPPVDARLVASLTVGELQLLLNRCQHAVVEIRKTHPEQ